MFITDKIFFCVFNIPILRQALCDGVISGLIGKKKALVDGGKIDKKREAQENGKYKEDRCETRAIFEKHLIHQYHRKGKNSIIPESLLRHQRTFPNHLGKYSL